MKIALRSANFYTQVASKFEYKSLMKKIIDKEITLLEALQEISKESSKTTLRSWIKEGRVLLNERPLERADHLLKPQEVITIGPKVQFLRGGIRLLFEDRDLLVLEKPAGLLSVATDFDAYQNVHAILKRRARGGRVYPVHRLDRETSGLLLFALSEKARDGLKRQFEEHLIEKTYYAIVENPIEKEEGSWESYLEEDDFYFVKTSKSRRAKHAVTHYTLVRNQKRYALLCLRPTTGRKNQLRVHCSEAAHPIVGDKKYGSSSNPVKRMCLHAQRIAFTHPVTGKRLEFSLPLPEPFYQLFPTICLPSNV